MFDRERQHPRPGAETGVCVGEYLCEFSTILDASCSSKCLLEVPCRGWERLTSLATIEWPPGASTRYLC
jgi:hypothetical protein